jgi:hypothetical protein
MSTASLTTVFRELFAAPLESVCQAERDYRKVWIQWLRDQMRLVTGKDGKLKEGVNLDQILNLAPVVNLDGVVEVAITMRIAEVKEKKGDVSGGLQVGPIHTSGSFGFSNQSSEESVLQASTRFAISNNQKSLGKYLKDRNIAMSTPEDVNKAIALLETGLNE